MDSSESYLDNIWRQVKEEYIVFGDNFGIISL